jgi:hypothetical protein
MFHSGRLFEPRIRRDCRMTIDLPPNESASFRTAPVGAVANQAAPIQFTHA